MFAAPRWSRPVAASLLVALVGCAGTRAVAPPLTDAEAAWHALEPATTAPRVGLMVPTVTRWGAVWVLPSLRDPVPAMGPGDDRLVLFDRAVARVPRATAGVDLIVGTVEAALVTVAYAGSRDGAWFQSARATRFDGTARAPLDLAATLDDARRRWDAQRPALEAALGPAVDQAGAATPGQPLAVERDTTVEGLAPSWTDGQLEVVWILRRERVSERITGGGYGCSKTYPLDRGEPSPVPCAPRLQPMITTRRTYAATAALVLVYDRRGALVDERVLPARATPGPGLVTTER